MNSTGAKAIRLVSSGLWLAYIPTVAAQTARGPIPPIRPLGPILATSKELLKTIPSIRPLSDGRVLAHDEGGRRVVVFDPALAHATTIIDTTEGTAKAYGTTSAALFPYFGDSSLFVDEGAQALLVLDPAGKIVRTMAAPAQRGIMGSSFLTRPAVHSAFLATGYIVAFIAGGTPTGQVVLDAAGLPPPLAPLPGRPDSGALARINIATRQWDTVAYLALPTNYVFVANGQQLPMRNPLPRSDDFTVLSDGTIAIVRAHDYHVDWLSPDGHVSASPPIAHQWIRLSDSAKAAIVDSARQADSLAAIPFASQMAANLANSRARMATSGRGGDPNDSIRQQAFSGAGFFPDPSVLPDYLPPFGTIMLKTGNARMVAADADDNLWIRARLLNPPEGGPVYDIVNRQGVLIDRIQIPGATAVIGFGPGVVYLTSRVGTGVQLARARIR